MLEVVGPQLDGGPSTSTVAPSISEGQNVQPTERRANSLSDARSSTDVRAANCGATPALTAKNTKWTSAMILTAAK